MKRTVTIEISGLEHSLKRFAKAWRTGRRAGEVISFESPEVLFRRITPKRWTLLTVLQSSGPLSVRELTRQVQRNVKNVHGDVQALIEIGLIERRGSTVRVPFDEIRTAFRLTRAARADDGAWASDEQTLDLANGNTVGVRVRRGKVTVSRKRSGRKTRAARSAPVRNAG